MKYHYTTDGELIESEFTPEEESDYAAGRKVISNKNNEVIFARFTSDEEKQFRVWDFSHACSKMSHFKNCG